MKEFNISGFGDPVTVKEADLDGNLGCFDERTGEILVDKDSPEPGKHIVLIHEILHLAETALIQGGIINDRIDHEFISNVAPMLLWSLVESGYYTGISKEELGCFMEEEMAKLDDEDDDDDSPSHLHFEPIICDGCKRLINPDMCSCGWPTKDHGCNSNHGLAHDPVPEGCECDEE